MKEYAVAVGALFFCAASVAFASAECAAIAGDKERLTCYDLEYKPTVESTVASSWVVEESVSKMDDSKTVVIYTESEESVPGRFGGRTNGTLLLRCHENSTAAFFKIGDHFLSSIQGYGEVDYRLDSDKLKKTSMEESTDNGALGHWAGYSAIPFIKGMIDHKTMVARITPFNESAITLTFPIAGLKEAVAPLRKACGW